MWETAYKMIKYVEQYREDTNRAGVLSKIEIKGSDILYGYWSPLGPYTLTLTTTRYSNIYYINDELVML